MSTWNSDYVATCPPAPGDIFVVTTIQGQRVAVQPLADYGKAMATARAFASKTRHPIKVFCMSLHELLRLMGTTVAEFAAGISPETDQMLRQAAIEGCLSVLRECNDPTVRQEACDVLAKMGVLKQ